ncbi:MAG: hypothetical protein ITG00_01890 [Flavobacterium sp.]|nr:hypothetical protein [Flavobacterium sp.]
MAYYYELSDENLWKAFPAFYGEIEANGETETIVKYFNGEIKGYETKVSGEILKRIEEIGMNQTDDFFKHKIDSTVIDLYHGPIIRFQLQYNNGHVTNLTIREQVYDSATVYFPFMNLYKTIASRKNEIDISEDVINLYVQKQGDFIRFARKIDSINLEFPPPPNPDVQLIFLK